MGGSYFRLRPLGCCCWIRLSLALLVRCAGTVNPYQISSRAGIAPCFGVRCAHARARGRLVASLLGGLRRQRFLPPCLGGISGRFLSAARRGGCRFVAGLLPPCWGVFGGRAFCCRAWQVCFVEVMFRVAPFLGGPDAWVFATLWPPGCLGFCYTLAAQ